MLPSQPLLSTTKTSSKRHKYGCKSCCILCIVVIIFVAVFIWSNTASFTNHGSLDWMRDKAAASSIFIESQSESQKPPKIKSIRYNVQDVKEFLDDNGPESEEWSTFHQELIALCTDDIDESMQSNIQFEMHDDDYYVQDSPISAYRERRRKRKRAKTARAPKPVRTPRTKNVESPQPPKPSSPKASSPAPTTIAPTTSAPTTTPAPLPPLPDPIPIPQPPKDAYPSNLHCWTSFKDYSYYAPEDTVNIDCGYDDDKMKGYVRTGCMARHLYTTKHWGVQLTSTRYEGPVTIQGCESRTNENLGTWVGARCCQIYNDAMEWPTEDNTKSVLSESDSNFDDDGEYEGSCAETSCNDDDRIIIGCNAHSEPKKAAQFGFMGSRITDDGNVCTAQNEMAWSMVVSQSVCAQSVKGGTLECIRVDEEESAVKVYDDGHQKTYRSKGVYCPNGYSMTDCNAYVVRNGDKHHSDNGFECGNEVSILSFSSERSYGEYVVGDCCQAWGSTDKMRAQISCCKVVAEDEGINA